MKHYKKTLTGEIYAFESDGSQDAYITADLTPISDAELDEIRKPTPAQQAQLIAAKVDALWCSADAVVTGSISGVALSILTVGVLQSKPKALAVANWSKSIWAEYYARKALVTADSVDDLDFSSFGGMPCTVPELQAEIGL